MAAGDLDVLSAFVAVAEERSFTRAARRLAVSPSALSHAIRRLEERLGVRLLARTTRSVAPTRAGSELLARLQPAFQDVQDALDRLTGFRDRPAGHVRLAVSPMAATLVLGPRLGRFAEDYPNITVEVSTRGDRVDLVAGGFDAGIQLGEYVERDMVAVRVSADQRAAIVASPRYFETHPRPLSPRDLPHHRCINFRRGQSGLYRWEFEKNGHALSVAVSGSVVVDSADLLIRAALDGAGLAFGFDAHVAPLVASGALVRVLEDWCPPFDGYFLYYPSRRQQPAALSAFIAAMRLDAGSTTTRRSRTPSTRR
ncbi:MAG TPA: LysR family transcriptional regulator [Vicinamibacterales bacterium]|nr:LysR family transcriptional regulator [Vicinamibacterales bacterium]